MEETISIGDRCVLAGADGRPETVVEIVGRTERVGGWVYEVAPVRTRKPGAPRRTRRDVPASELFRLRPAESA